MFDIFYSKQFTASKEALILNFHFNFVSVKFDPIDFIRMIFHFMFSMPYRTRELLGSVKTLLSIWAIICFELIFEFAQTK